MAEFSGKVVDAQFIDNEHSINGEYKNKLTIHH